MEILFVSHKYPPSIGGMEKQSYELINGMKQYAKVHSLVYTGKGSKLIFFLTLNKKINRLCREHPGISLIHFNEGLIGAISLLHKGYEHLKRVVTLHGLDVVFPNKIYQHRIIKKFNRFDLIIAVSSATAKAGLERGLWPDKVVVINNGLVTQTVNPGADERRVLVKKYNLQTSKRYLIALGRPVKRKGFSWFIRYVLPFLHPDCQLLLIGPFKQKKSLKTQVLKLLPVAWRNQIDLFLGAATDEEDLSHLLANKTVSKRVRHLGRLPAADLQELLKIADAFVMPNISVHGDMEGFGLVCLEAALAGTTVFAADSGGITDAIHHRKNGYLIQTGNAHVWISTLNRFVGKPKAFRLTPEAIQAYTLQHFSRDKMVREYYHYFCRLLAAR